MINIVSAINDGDPLHNYHIVPVGGVIAWLKSYTNTPTLGEAWVECNGQLISDAESPFNGQNAPDLNSSVGGNKGYFLRGHTESGSTELSQNLAHTHDVTHATALGGTTTILDQTSSASTTGNSTWTISNGGTEARPVNYSVVWILRIK